MAVAIAAKELACVIACSNAYVLHVAKLPVTVVVTLAKRRVCVTDYKAFAQTSWLESEAKLAVAAKPIAAVKHRQRVIAVANQCRLQLLLPLQLLLRL